jgi:ribosome-associated toxin RatA of RatAB toxin-antitoxin module
VKEVLAEARFGDVPVAAFWRAVGDVHRYDEFVPFVKRSDVIRTCDRTGDAWVYNVVKPPVASPRDYVIRVSSDAPAGSPGSPSATNARGDDASSVLRSSWTIDDAHGPNPKRGTIRLRQNRGSWELTDDGRGGCAVKYRVFTDPGAALPGWLVDVANKTSVPDVLRAFAKRAVDGTYERDDAEEAAAAAKAKAAAKAERAFDAFAGFERRTATFRDETMDRLGERFGGLAAALPEAVGALAANALAAGKGWKGSA